jgi:anthranilate synthase component II
MRIAMIDNYDSFTYNLVQYLSELGATVEVVRNDAVTAEAVIGAAPDGVVISPGPGTPDDAGISVEVVHACVRSAAPLLGVCLGHQAIGAAFGARIVRARSIMHGKVSRSPRRGAVSSRPAVALRGHPLSLAW